MRAKKTGACRRLKTWSADKRELCANELIAIVAAPPDAPAHLSERDRGTCEISVYRRILLVAHSMCKAFGKTAADGTVERADDKRCHLF
ncbi:hypothetical protein EVAR_54047_1 [Eumeta japonica]|uniref:Uncharacterized protein n=1 Tax=Eumeta variegata TaxID=151549 RepID=A0A4C1YN46_EUMVA|nr:hypothetical protein EVAR_54047_1 [Eumeta japonica]